MPRIRTIKPSFFKDDDLADHQPLTRILFEGLWCLADGHGRLEDRPRYIKVEALPYDDCDVDKMLQALHDTDFIIRYEVQGQKFIQIPNFRKHQRITGKEAETPSLIPEYQRGNNGETSNVQEGNGKEGNGKEGNGVKDSAELPQAVAPAPADPVVLTFPTKGKMKTWDLTQTKLDGYVRDYQGIGVIEQFKRALRWCDENPAKQKTAKGMASFLTRWLNRVADSPKIGGQNNVGDAKPKPGKFSTVAY